MCSHCLLGIIIHRTFKPHTKELVCIGTCSESCNSSDELTNSAQTRARGIYTVVQEDNTHAGPGQVSVHEVGVLTFRQAG